MKKLAFAVASALASCSVYAADNTFNISTIGSVNDTINLTQSAEGIPSDYDSVINVTLLNTELNLVEVTQEINLQSTIDVLAENSQENNFNIHQINGSENTIVTTTDNSRVNDITVCQDGPENIAYVDITDSTENSVSVGQHSSLTTTTVELNNAHYNNVTLRSTDNSVGGRTSVVLSSPGEMTESNQIFVSESGSFNETYVSVYGADNNIVSIQTIGYGNLIETVFSDENSDINSHSGTIVGDTNSIQATFEQSYENQLTTNISGNENIISVNLTNTSYDNQVNINQNNSFAIASVDIGDFSNTNNINITQDNSDITTLSLSGVMGSTINVAQY